MKYWTRTIYSEIETLEQPSATHAFYLDAKNQLFFIEHFFFLVFLHSIQ